MIKYDCFWYRPWKDMSATIDQCDLAETGECPCEENCILYVSKIAADGVVLTHLNIIKKLKTN